MRYDELLQMVEESEPDDWVREERGAGVVAVLKEDLNVRIELDSSDENSRQFSEDWTEQFPDRKAVRHSCVLWYGGSPIREFGAVAVDGYRAYLPIPRMGTTQVDALSHAVVAAIDIGNRFDEYMSRAGFQVTE